MSELNACCISYNPHYRILSKVNFINEAESTFFFQRIYQSTQLLKLLTLNPPGE